jgi:lipopolysaccharide/colanic/teichoic acid biosynthesis glycosyltransferase
MKKVLFLSNMGSLLRQAIWAWIILLASIILFVIFALLLALVINSQEIIILMALILVSPFLVYTHLFLRRQDYPFVIPNFLKRIFDIVISICLLILLNPVLLFISIAIRLESSGPILFRRRILIDNKTRQYIKFRTLYLNSDEILATHPKLQAELAQNGSFDLREDPRITRVGYFLRRTNLDALPMLYSVLLGDASFFGHRLEEINSGQKEESKIPIWLGDSLGILRAQELQGLPSM